MLKKTFTFLIQPYPFEKDLKRTIITILGFGVFVSLFIGLFLAGELEGIKSILIILGFGMITITVMIFNLIILPAVIPFVFREEKWIIIKEICFHLWIIFQIGMGNLLFARWGGYYEINLTTFMETQFTTLMVGIFPVTLMVLLKQNRLLKKYANEAVEINSSIQHTNPIFSKKNKPDKFVSLLSESGKEQIKFQLENLLMIKAVDNYVEIYSKEEESIRKALLRNSLKRVEDHLNPYFEIFRCHRSYMINVKNIEKTSGNSQGYRVFLKGIEETIPVARSYSKIFRQIINSN